MNANPDSLSVLMVNSLESGVASNKSSWEKGSECGIKLSWRNFVTFDKPLKAALYES